MGNIVSRVEVNIKHGYYFQYLLRVNIFHVNIIFLRAMIFMCKILHNTNITSQLRWLVLCILHSMIFAKKKNKNASKKYEGRLADICDVISRDYIVAFP